MMEHNVEALMSTDDKLRIAYFSDVLCVWAYISQIRMDELKKQLGARIAVSYHFIPLFGCTEHRIGVGWQDRGAYSGFGRHVQEVCSQFPHVQVDTAVWNDVIPKSSAPAHHFLKAVQLLEQERIIAVAPQDRFAGRSLFEEAIWRVRCAFFQQAQDVSRLDCLLETAEQLKLPRDEVLERMNNGEAMAAMCRDNELCGEYRVEGSPTYILNEGRQKLYGNVGYKIIEANVEEVLRRPEQQASWC
jgi:predicted DsbA family dithiol-disulfide isomerase